MMGKTQKRSQSLLAAVLVFSLLLTMGLTGLSIPAAADPVAGNLIVNGDFEQGASVNWGNKSWVKAGVGENGTWGMELDSKGEQFYKAAIALQPNTTYLFTMRYRCPDITFRIWSNTIPGVTGYMTKTPSWKTYRKIFTTSDSVSMNTGWDLSIIRDSETGEACYMDNLSIVPIPANTPQTDLTVSGLSWDVTSVRPGNAVGFSASVTNHGEVSIPAGAFKVDFRVDAATVYTVTSSAALAAGQSVTVSTTADQKWTATAGDHTISAVVTTLESALETDVTNNDYSRSLRVAATDLAIPTVAEAAGFTQLTFSDDFDSLSTIDTQQTGDAGYKWYVTRPYGASALTTGDYSISNSVLTIKDDESTYNYGLATVDVDTHTGFAYNKGYLEFRIRMSREPISETGSGIPAIWSLPPEKLWGNATEWVEVDFMEYWGMTGETQGFTTTLHHTTDDMHHRNANYGPYTSLSDGEFHTMGFLWRDGLFECYVDGTQYMRYTYGEDVMPNPASSDNSVGDFAYLDSQFLPLIISGAERWPLEIDWIRVWQEDEPDPTVTGLVLNKTATTLYPYESELLTASAVPTGASAGVLTWSSSNQAVAIVEGDGLVRGVAPGTATVTVTDNNGHSATCTVTVETDPSLVTNGGFETNYTAPWAGYLSNGATIEAGVGEDGSYGLVIPANVQDYYYKSAISLLPNRIYRLTLRHKGPELRLGFNTYSDLTFTWGNNSPYLPAGDTWQTKVVYIHTGDNPSISANWGWYIKRDNASTAVTYLDNFQWLLMPEVTQISPGRTAITLAPGMSKTMTTTVTPADADGYALNWSSSNTAVATVSSAGVITAVAEGQATITVTSGSISATCNVTVDNTANRILDGDFEEGNADWSWTWSILNDSRFDIAEDPDDANNHCLSVAQLGTSQSRYYGKLQVEQGKTYRVSGRVKGTGIRLYVTSSYCSAGDGWHTTGGSDGVWTEFSFLFTTKTETEMGTTAFNKNYILAIGNFDGPTSYLDDLSVVEVIS